jgi:hypothetical protein
MSSKCSVCGTNLDNGQPQGNGMCIDCFADELCKVFERYQVVNPFCDVHTEHNNDSFEVEYDTDNNDYILIVDSIKQTISAGTTVIKMHDIAKNMKTGKACRER